MPSQKAPALITPRKMGLFVSLVLVSLSAAISYFYVRTFGITWDVRPFEFSAHWFRTQLWYSLLEGRGFVYQVLPLVAIVGLTAVLSYFLIVRAVRQYMRYLDSGFDYRNLIQSLQDVQDLDDTSEVPGLGQHPELRKFLLRMRDKASARAKALDDREKAIAERLEKVSKDKDLQVTQRLNEDCTKIVDALRNVDRGLPESLDLRVLELKRVEDAIRRTLANAATSGSPSVPAALDGHGAPGRTEAADRRIRERVEAISQDFVTAQAAAQNVERQLAEVAGALPVDFDPADDQQCRGELEALVDSLSGLDGLSDSLGELGERAKEVAIETATRAGSSGGTQSDLIRLAEDVREMAVLFSETAKSYHRLTDSARQSTVRLQAGVDRVMGTASSISRVVESTSAAASRLNAWVERVALLSDRVRELEKSLEHPGEGMESDAISSFDLELETMDNPVFSIGHRSETTMPTVQHSRETEPAPVGEVAPEEQEMFAEFERAVVDTPPVTGPVSERMPPTSQATGDDDRRDRKAAPSPHTGTFDVELPDAEDVARILASQRPSDGRPGAAAPKSTAVMVDYAEDTEAIDLYELGAVDYDSALHGTAQGDQ